MSSRNINQIRSAYAARSYSDAGVDVLLEEFDRALAAFKRDTEIALLERLADSVRYENGTEASGHTSTYSIRKWLRAKANELRKEQTDGTN